MVKFDCQPFNCLPARCAWQKRIFLSFSESKITFAFHGTEMRPRRFDLAWLTIKVSFTVLTLTVGCFNSHTFSIAIISRKLLPTWWKNAFREKCRTTSVRRKIRCNTIDVNAELPGRTEATVHGGVKLVPNAVVITHFRHLCIENQNPTNAR